MLVTVNEVAAAVVVVVEQIIEKILLISVCFSICDNDWRLMHELNSFRPRYIKVKVEHYLLFMFSPPKIS